MSNVVTEIREDGSALIELPRREMWTPSVGEVFFMPNVISSAKPVVDFDWADNINDKACLAAGLVCRTPQEALEMRHILIGFAMLGRLLP
jgi:hypothetical protein